MFITKKYLSRRTFLRSSVGIGLALPFLDAMVPAQTPLAKTAARPLQRFGFVYVPHGSIMKDWTPAQEGVGFEFSPILKPVQTSFLRPEPTWFSTSHLLRSASCMV